MTAHIRAETIDPDHVATLSKKTLEDVLRKKIGFQGVVVSDSLVMQGILQECPSVEEAVLRAFEAGCDILLLGGRQLMGSEKVELTPEQIVNIHQTLVTAVKTERIALSRLDASVRRILTLKEKYGLFKPISFPTVKTAEHEALAQKVAALSVKMMHNRLPPQFSLDQQKVMTLAPQALSTEIAWEGEKVFTKSLILRKKKLKPSFLAQKKWIRLFSYLSTPGNLKPSRSCLAR